MKRKRKTPPQLRLIYGKRLFWYNTWEFIRRIPQKLLRPIVRRMPPMQVNAFEWGMPICPRCGEMTFNPVECIFCGQRLEANDYLRKLDEPPMMIVMDCFVCGGKDTMIGHRSRINNHFHGMCANCGARMME
jgi:hypothetical protein